jgi:hypothetical protein
MKYPQRSAAQRFTQRSTERRSQIAPGVWRWRWRWRMGRGTRVSPRSDFAPRAWLVATLYASTITCTVHVHEYQHQHAPALASSSQQQPPPAAGSRQQHQTPDASSSSSSRWPWVSLWIALALAPACSATPDSGLWAPALDTRHWTLSTTQALDLDYGLYLDSGLWPGH